MSTETESIAPPASADEETSRSLDLTRRFMLAAVADPAVLDEVPDGATLVLVPDDDRTRADEEVTAGLSAMRGGRDVYFRHVRLADLPE